MSSVVKSRKRKVEECEEGKGQVIKEEKRMSPGERMAHSRNSLNLLRLVPEDWAPVVIPVKQEEDVVEVEQNLVTRGTSWTGKGVSPLNEESHSKLALSCKRFPNTSSSSSCETQTCHFILDAACDTSRNLPLRDEIQKDNLVRKCCVIDCGSDSSARGPFYCLPSKECERRLWADILGVEFSDASEEDAVQEICSEHFVKYEDPVTVTQNSAKPAASPIPKAKTRKKRTCDILIAEEAEKVKQSMTTGRSKRTPKPNRHYDWAELIPLSKNDSYELEEVASVSSATTSVSVGTSKSGKQHHDKRRDKENDKPSIEVSIGMSGETQILEVEAEDYGLNISLPSAPRPPPPKSKGRPHKIQDSCAQTDGSPCLSRASRGPLREVKVQCNLTGEPLNTCSSCSNIDWKSLDGVLSNIAVVVEDEELCHPSIRKPINDVLLLNSTKTSYALNVLKILCGLERDNLESVKDIVLASGEDELEEVEIENVIHEEEAPVSGVKEIIPKLWNKNSQVKKEISLKDETITLKHEAILDDQDSLGLREATDQDDDEFRPDYSAFEEEEDDEDEDELEDDEDWDLKNKDDPGVPLPRKKKGRQKVKKGEQKLGGETEDQEKGGTKESESDDHRLSLREEVQHKVDLILSEEKSRREMMEKDADTKEKHKSGRKVGDNRWQRGIYKCPQCIKEFSTKLKMDRHHQHIHLGIAPWKGTHLCEECGKTFTQKIGLRVHRMHRHGDPKLFECSMCNFKAATKAKLARHALTHYNERIYSCEICGLALKTPETYKNHMTLHTNEGKYRCDVCHRGFHHKHYYEDHYRSHFNDRSYQCDMCHTAFKTQKSLRVHMRGVHLNDKRIICRLCGARFMTNFNLRIHMKKHERAGQAQAKYFCHLCNEKFPKASDLETHHCKLHTDYCEPIQIKVEQTKTNNMASVGECILRLKEDASFESESFCNAEIEHVIHEFGSGVICSKIDLDETCTSLGPIEIVEAVVEDYGNGVKEKINVFYEIPCDLCTSTFPSQDLLNLHKHTLHFT